MSYQILTVSGMLREYLCSLDKGCPSILCAYVSTICINNTLYYILLIISNKQKQTLNKSFFLCYALIYKQTCNHVWYKRGMIDTKYMYINHNPDICF